MARAIRLVMAGMTFVLGLTFACAGVALLRGFGPLADRDQARVAALPVVGAEDFAAGPPGRAVLVEGRIAATNPPRHGELVAYTESQYTGGECKRPADTLCTRYVGSTTPPLILDLPGGPVRTTGDRYAIERPPAHAGPPYTPYPSRDPATGEYPRRYDGFAAGDTIFAIGTVVVGPNGPTLAAERVVGGTRAGYLADVRGAGLDLTRGGMLLIAAAVALLAAGSALLWRAIRRPATR